MTDQDFFVGAATNMFIADGHGHDLRQITDHLKWSFDRAADVGGLQVPGLEWIPGQGFVPTIYTLRHHILCKFLRSA